MEQRSKEWYDARIGRVTGSRIAGILGLSPWQSADDILRDMVRQHCGAPSEFTGNAATKWGQFHEAGAIAELELFSGVEVEPCGLFVHPEHNWLAASPDGLIPRYQAVLEVKCPFNLRDATDPVPFKSLEEQPGYYSQIQYEMACSGKRTAVFYQWCPAGTHVEMVEFDPDFIADTLPRLEAFHRRYLRAIEDPAEHLEPRLRTVATLEADKLVQEYAELQDAADRAKDRLDEIRARLIQLADGKPSIVGGARVVPVERAGSMRAAAVFKRLQELDPTATEDQFRGKPSSSWRITVR